MVTHPSTDRNGRGSLARVVEKLRATGATLLSREEPSGLSVESRVANRKGRRR